MGATSITIMIGKYFSMNGNNYVVYGGLVGGPDRTGNYIDDREKYVYTEVATDYNAGFTAMLCKMLEEYGGKNCPHAEQGEARSCLSKKQ